MQLWLSVCVEREKMKDNQKYLTLSDRFIIEQGLNEGKIFTTIAT